MKKSTALRITGSIVYTALMALSTTTMAATPTYPADLFGGLKNWHLTLPVNKDSKQAPADEVRVDSSPDGHAKLGTYSSSYFKLNAAKDAIVMTSLFGGSTTSSGTAFARSELREHDSDYSPSAWSCKSKVRAMIFTARVVKPPVNKPEMSLGQIHDDVNDNLKIQFNGPHTIRAYMNDGNNTVDLDTQYNVGDKITVGVYANQKPSGTLDKGYMNISYKNLNSGATKTIRQQFTGVIGSCYFKAGNYHQACTKKNIYGGTNQVCADKGWDSSRYESSPTGTSVMELYGLQLK